MKTKMKTVLALLLVLTVFISMIQVQLVYGATVFTSTLAFNSTQDANTNVLAGSRAQVKLINMTAGGTAYGPYDLNSTGGYLFSNIGNATDYRLDFYWDGTKVYHSANITTSATAGAANTAGPFTVEVYSFQITAKDSNGDTITADSIVVTAANGSDITYTSVTGFTISQAGNGSWSVAVKYRTSTFGTVQTMGYTISANTNENLNCSRLEVDVSGSGIDFYVSPSTVSLNTAIYSSNILTLKYTDSSGVTSTSKIYTGGKGKPRRLIIGSDEFYEGNAWQYDRVNDEVVVTWWHLSAVDVELDWTEISASGEEPEPEAKPNINLTALIFLVVFLVLVYLWLSRGKRR